VRTLVLLALAMAMLVPAASGAIVQEREAFFPMAKGFEDRLTVVSGEMELGAPSVSKSAGFFRTSSFSINGISRACWQQSLANLPTCVDGPLRLVVPTGASFGLNSRVPYAVDIEAAHSLVTFVDLSQADGFNDRLRVGPSAISSLVEGRVSIPDLPAVGSQSPIGFTLLEAGKAMELRDASGLLLHSLRFNDQPLLVEGDPRFPATFGAAVAVLPFEDGASATFRPAADEDAAIGLAPSSMAVLDEILSNVRIIPAGAKAAPFAILEKAGAVLSEVFNGAFLRTRLADDPNGLGDVAFAKFTELTITADDGSGRLAFEGSYTLVVGDLGPSFDNSSVSNESQGLRLWVGLFILLAILVVAAWLWLRDGPIERTAPGAHTWIARVATAIGVVAAFLVWDWQMNQVLGSSLLTTEGSGSGLGAVALLEVGSLALAALLIGLPVFLIVRYGLALAKQPKYASLAATAGVFFTVAIGILVLPALVSFIASLAA
jgi:hypothetical protein